MEPKLSSFGNSQMFLNPRGLAIDNEGKKKKKKKKNMMKRYCICDQATIGEVYSCDGKFIRRIQDSTTMARSFCVVVLIEVEVCFLQE